MRWPFEAYVGGREGERCIPEARSCDGIARGGFEAALAGKEGDTGHDQEDAQPTDGGDRLVKDEDGGEEAEDVADAE